MRTATLSIALALLALAPAPGRADCGNDPAVQALERAHKADSKNATTAYNLSVALYNKQCYREAVGAFERTLKLIRGDGPEQKDLRFQCHAALGGLYYQALNDPRKAIPHFKAALALDPGDKDSLNGMSLALMKSGNEKEAEEYLRKAILADPSNVETRYRMAVMLNQRLERQGAKADPKLRSEVTEAFAKTAELAERNPRDNAELLVVSYTRLGELHRDADRPRQAVQVLEKAVRLAPNDFNSRFILGQMHYKLRNYAAMIEQYQKAVEIDPSQKLARFNLGVAYINQEQYFEAYEQFKAISEADRRDSEALALMGQTLERAVDQQLSLGAAKFTAEEYAEALAAFEKVLSVDPRNKIALDYQARAQKAVDTEFKKAMDQAKAAIQAKRQEDAALFLEKALSLKPGNAEAEDLRKRTRADIGKLVQRYLTAGERAFARGDFETAEREWTRARGFAQGRAKANANLAKLRERSKAELKRSLTAAKGAMQRKDYVAARNAYRAALAADRDNAEARNGLTQVNTLIADQVKKLVDTGRARMDAGDSAAARTNFEAALKLDPNNADANRFVTRLTGSESRAKVDADKVRTLYYQGVDLYVNNKIREAIKAWEELLKLDANHQDAKKNIERARVKLKALQAL